MQRGRWLIVAAVAALGVAFLGWTIARSLRPAMAWGEGRVAKDPHVVDLGFVCPGERPHFKVRVLNVGSGPLRLGEVEASCGCTDLRIGDKYLEPGAETLLSGRLRLSLKEETFNHVVWIMDPAGNRRLGQLALRGRAAWPVQASTELINLGDLRAGTPATAELQIYSPQRVAFKIESIESTAPFIRVVRQDMVKGRVQLAIEVQPPAAGEIEEALTIHTSHPKRPVLMVTIRGRVRGDVWLASHSTLFLGSRQPAERVERTLTVRCTRPELGKVTHVRVEGEDWQLADWSYVAGQGSTTAVVRVGLIVPHRQGMRRCTLRLETACGMALEAAISCVVQADGED